MKKSKNDTQSISKARSLLRSEIVKVTGTTLANGTFDEILNLARAARKRLVVYGTTAAGVCRLMGLERWCSLAQNG